MILIKKITANYQTNLDGVWELHFEGDDINSSDESIQSLINETKISRRSSFHSLFKVGECLCTNNIISGSNLPNFIKNKESLQIKIYKYKIYNTPFDTGFTILDTVFNNSSNAYWLENFNFQGSDLEPSLFNNWKLSPFIEKIDTNQINLYKINEQLDKEDLELLSRAFYYEILWFDDIISSGYCNILRYNSIIKYDFSHNKYVIKDNNTYIGIPIVFTSNMSIKNPRHGFNNVYVEPSHYQYGPFYPLKKIKITTGKLGAHTLHQNPYIFGGHYYDQPINRTDNYYNVDYFKFVDYDTYMSIDSKDGYGSYYRYPTTNFITSMSQVNQYIYNTYFDSTIRFQIYTGVFNGIDYNTYYYEDIKAFKIDGKPVSNFNWFETQTLYAYRANPITGKEEIYDEAIYEPVESY